MRLWIAFAVLLLCTASFANFIYLGAFNGTNSLDNSDYYLFQQPFGLLYSDGKLFVTDQGKNALFILNASAVNSSVANQRIGSVFSTSSEAKFSNPHRMQHLNGLIYVADGTSSKIKVYEGTGTNVLDWNSGSNMERPSSLLFDQNYAYITDQAKGRVYAYFFSTQSYSHIAIPEGGSDGKLQSPSDIEFYKGRFYVSDSSKGLVFVYDSNFTFINSIGRSGGGLISPRGIQVYQDRLYVADAPSKSVVVFTLDGYPIETLGMEGNLSYPEDIAIGGDRLYVSDSLDKLVKVYQINQTSGNDTVLQMINSAKQSLSRLYALQDVAARLNVPAPSSSAASDIAQAQSDYSNFLFSSAAVLAQKAQAGADASYDELSLAMEVPIKKLAKESTDKVAPYRSRLTGDLAVNLLQFDNKVVQVNTLLASKSYSASYDAALSLAGSADALIASLNSNQQAQEEATKAKKAREFELELQAAEGKLSRLKLDSLQYRQELNVTTSEKLLSESRMHLSEGDLEAANHSLSLALLELSAYSTSIESSKSGIVPALANYTLIEFSFNATANQRPLLPPDLSSERLMLYQGRDTIYSNPQLGLQMASKASEAASSKMRDAQAISTSVAAVISILFAICLIGAAFGIHLMRRRSKKKEHHPQGEAEEQEGEELAEKASHHKGKVN